MLEQELIELLGPGALVTDRADRARYEKGYRHGDGRAVAIVRPSNAEDVSALVRYARSAGHRLVPQGAHTGLVGGATPDEGGAQIVVSLERLRDLSIDPVGRTATCGAGLLLSALNAAAVEHGLTLPIDLGADPSIGGMVAANTGGARLIRYGDMRRQTLGLEMVLSDEDGTILSDMRGLRKNNVGLDLKQMLIGTGGQAGIITGVEVELQPLVTQTATALVVPHSLDCIVPVLAALERRLGPFLTACEGMSANALSAALDHHPALPRPFSSIPPFCLLVEASSSIAASEGIDVEQMLANSLMEFLEGDEPLLRDVIMGRGNDFWRLRHAISDGLKASGTVIGMDIAVRRSSIAAVRQALTERVSARFPALRICDFGHVGDGGLHFNLVAPHGDAAAGAIPGDLVRSFVFDAVVREFGGSFSAEHGIGPSNIHFLERYADVRGQGISRALCAVMDPAGLLRR